MRVRAALEARDVGAAFGGGDIVDEGVDVLGELRRVLHGDFHAHLFQHPGDVDDFGMGRLAGPVEVLDELQHAALVVERFPLAAAIVVEDDLDAAVEKGQLLEAAMENAVVELGDGEDQTVGLEGGLGTDAIGGADAADVADRLAPLVLLLVDVPVAADFHLAPLGEEVDHGDAHPVQTAGSLVGPLGKLAAELEHGHHALERGEAQVGVDLDGDAAAVVLDRHRAVVVDGHEIRGSPAIASSIELSTTS